MQNRFKFRAGITLHYYKENDDDGEVQITIYNMGVDIGGRAITVDKDYIINALRKTQLSEYEQETAFDYVDTNFCEANDYYYIDDIDFIEQCTGLKDKNGNLIYEKDIVKCGKWDLASTDSIDDDEYIEEIGVVNYYQPDAKFVINYSSESEAYEISLPECQCGVLGNCIIEVIGNIHENPELLENKND